MKNHREGSKIEYSVKKEAQKFGIGSVLVALSGGADSVATAYALQKIGLRVIALHCNFHLRGDESDRDAAFVESFCKENGIELILRDFDIPGYLSSHKGESVEMACRKLRYEWFGQMLEETGYDKIATGHNADDNIETFFLNILRGSGTRGLRGMGKDTGKIWRPLLNIHRAEILEYLSENNLGYVTDSTNLQSDFRRNYLRNRIIPLLRKEWNGFDKTLDKTLQNIYAENLVVEDALLKALPDGNKALPVVTILNFPAPLLLIKRFIDKAGPFVPTPEEILDSIYANKPHIRKWRLKKGTVILRNGKLSVEMSHGESGS